MKVLPPLSGKSTLSVPPCNSTMCRLRDGPQCAPQPGRVWRRPVAALRLLELAQRVAAEQRQRLPGAERGRVQVHATAREIVGHGTRYTWSAC
jgi:hypothetical protein